MIELCTIKKTILLSLIRYLRSVYRNGRRPAEQSTSSSDTNVAPSSRENSNPVPSTSRDTESSASPDLARGWANLRDLFMGFAPPTNDNNNEDEETSSNINTAAASPTRESNNPTNAIPTVENVSSNNSDDNEDESDWYLNNSSSRGR